MAPSARLLARLRRHGITGPAALRAYLAANPTGGEAIGRADLDEAREAAEATGAEWPPE